MFVTVSFPAASCLRKPFRSWYRYMRIDVVTDTYEPDVNGVALTLGRLVGGLRMRGHLVHVMRASERNGSFNPGDRAAFCRQVPRQMDEKKAGCGIRGYGKPHGSVCREGRPYAGGSRGDGIPYQFPPVYEGLPFLQTGNSRRELPAQTPQQGRDDSGSHGGNAPYAGRAGV